MSVRSTAKPVSTLRRRMIEDMTIRNLSPATQRSYIHAVEGYGRYFGRSPDRLGLEDVRAYQVHLAGKGIAWATLNQIGWALRFLYGVTLGQDEVPERIPYARKPAALPDVLNRDEVVRIPEAVPSLKCRVALTTAYATGMRVSEVVAVEVRNIDSGRMVIRIEHGKGGKDRYVMLSAQLLGILRAYWKLTRPQQFLFPGRDPDTAVTVTVLRHAACRSAYAAAGIAKKVSVHTLPGIVFADASFGAGHRYPADILRHHGDVYRERNASHLSRDQLKVMGAACGAKGEARDGFRAG